MLQIVVFRKSTGRGGSAHLHDLLTEGDTIAYEPYRGKETTGPAPRSRWWNSYGSVSTSVPNGSSGRDGSVAGGITS